MPQLAANGLQLEVETLGDRAHPAVLLIMGLGMQLIAWPESLCQELVAAGFFVIRFDNRDIGLSEKIESARRVNLATAALRYFLRLPVSAPYRIETMADDAIGVLDALGIDKAHIVGVSLGGMIAQSLVAEHPQRCLSLSSIMSASGDRRMPTASLRISRLLMARPARNAKFEVLVEHFVRLFTAIGSPGFPTPPALMRERMRANLQRSYYPAGTARQLLAIVASGDRSAALRRIRRPTLVVHGDADPLVPVANGVDCARKIPGASLRIIPGMGHDLASGLLPILGDALRTHLHANNPN